MRSLALSCSLFGLALAGCGFIQVQTSGFGSTPSASSSAEAGSASAPGTFKSDGSPEGNAKAAVYAGMARADYKTGFADAVIDWRKQFGIDHSVEPQFDENPDPAWILEWKPGIMYGDKIATWGQAVANRTWEVEAKKAYAAWRKDFAKHDDELAQKVADIQKKPSFYERVPALRALLKESLDFKKADLPIDPTNIPGGAYLVQKAVIDEYVGHGRGWALSARDHVNAYTGYRITYTDRLRAWKSDPEELEYFLIVASRGFGGKYMPPLPMVHEYVGMRLSKSVKWPVPYEQYTRHDDPFLGEKGSKLPKEIVDLQISIPNYPRADVKDAKTETAQAILEKADPKEPKLVRALARVVSVDKKGAGAAVELATVATDADESCFEYGHITSIDLGTGQVHRQSSCKVTATRKTTRLFHATFDDWPAKIDKGAVVTFYGDVESVKTKGAPANMTVDITLKGRFVGCFTGSGPTDPKKNQDAFEGLGVPPPEVCDALGW